MNQALYEIREELRLCESMLMGWAEEHEGDVTEFPLNEELNKIELSLEKKALGIGVWIKNLLGESKMIAEEKNSLYKRETAAKNKASRLKAYLQGNIPVGNKFSDSRCTIGWRKSSQVSIECEPDKLPKEYQSVRIEANKTAIKQDLKSGVEMDFAHLETKHNIQIK